MDNMAGQFFYGDTGQTKYYTAEDSQILFIDNFYAITTLRTDDAGDGTWDTWNTGQTTGDFYHMPFNASTYSWIEVNPGGDYSFPTNRKGVEIIGDIGYAAVPDEIRLACYEIVNAANGRRSGQNLSGVAEVTAAGIVITPEDITPFAKKILKMYQRGY